MQTGPGQEQEWAQEQQQMSQHFWDRDEAGKRKCRNEGMKPEGTGGEEMRTKRQSEIPNSGKSPVSLGPSLSRLLELECFGGALSSA